MQKLNIQYGPKSIDKMFCVYWPDADARQVEIWARARIAPFCTPKDPTDTRLSEFSPCLSQTLRRWSMLPDSSSSVPPPSIHMRQSMDTCSSSLAQTFTPTAQSIWGLGSTSGYSQSSPLLFKCELVFALYFVHVMAFENKWDWEAVWIYELQVFLDEYVCKCWMQMFMYLTSNWTFWYHLHGNLQKRTHWPQPHTEH